ncbi:MAG TPA: hypothetical protein DDW73_19450, partial [Rhizobium sp.]|nr:hypothetical protein [Rhizobium sp.]
SFCRRASLGCHSLIDDEQATAAKAIGWISTIDVSVRTKVFIPLSPLLLEKRIMLTLPVRSLKPSYSIFFE